MYYPNLYTTLFKCILEWIKCTAACKDLFCATGSDQVPYRLPILPTCLPVPHQDVAPQYLWGKNKNKINVMPRPCLITIFNWIKCLSAVVSHTSQWNVFLCHRMEMCVFLYCTLRWTTRRAESCHQRDGIPPRMSGERSLALVISSRVSLLSGCLPSLSSIYLHQQMTWLIPLSHDICLQWPFSL